MPKVVCVHIGARAHYLIPKALQEKGNLHTLITDTWVGAAWFRRLLLRLPLTAFKSLAGRYSASIPNHTVYSFGLRFLLFECYLRLKYSYSWALTLARDRKFEFEALNKINAIQDAEMVLGISYTSLECFKAAKEKGLKTLLFQVDPGLAEEDLVAGLVQQSGQVTSWERAPESYWLRWKEECSLADRIFVNSQWSKTGLTAHGIQEDKIHILPLPFDLEKKHQEFQRNYPDAYTKQRPLRCLFLGTLALRKGIHVVLEAALALQDLPVEFILVGRNEVDEQVFSAPNIRYNGLVTREETDVLYQQSDVFLFPTLSDGFGLTQLEAMAWQLPVIASTHCGSVVEEDQNGWILNQVNAHALASVLKSIIEHPERLNLYASNCLHRVQDFSTGKFGFELDRVIGSVGRRQ